MALSSVYSVLVYMM